MMRYEGVKNIKAVKAVEFTININNIDGLVERIADALASLTKKRADVGSIYEMFYSVHRYFSKNIKYINHSAGYIRKHENYYGDVINTVKELLNSSRSFYFLYGMYVTEYKGDMMIITYKYYLTSVIKALPNIIVKIEELKDYEGPNIGRIFKR